MARGTMEMPEDFLMKISALADKTDEIIPRVLEAGGKIMLNKAQSNLRAVIGKGTKYKSRSTGKLADALGVSGARLDRNGNYNVKVGFREPRRGGESNAKIANIIEYGKKGQPPKPFLKPAKSAAKNETIQTMVDKLEEEINRI
jgi:HK97 gp10 family phage protein